MNTREEDKPMIMDHGVATTYENYMRGAQQSFHNGLRQEDLNNYEEAKSFFETAVGRYQHCIKLTDCYRFESGKAKMAQTDKESCQKALDRVVSKIKTK